MAVSVKAARWDIPSITEASCKWRLRHQYINNPLKKKQYTCSHIFDSLCVFTLQGSENGKALIVTLKSNWRKDTVWLHTHTHTCPLSEEAKAHGNLFGKRWAWDVSMEAQTKGSGAEMEAEQQHNTTSRVIFESNSRCSHCGGWCAKELKSSTSEPGESKASAVKRGLFSLCQWPAAGQRTVSLVQKWLLTFYKKIKNLFSSKNWSVCILSRIINVYLFIPHTKTVHIWKRQGETQLQAVWMKWTKSGCWGFQGFS